MRQVLGWMWIVVLCLAAGAMGEASPDKREQQAVTAFNEAVAFYQSGRYADAIARGEQALSMSRA